jgi:hypothetical protein
MTCYTELSLTAVTATTLTSGTIIAIFTPVTSTSRIGTTATCSTDLSNSYTISIFASNENISDTDAPSPQA